MLSLPVYTVSLGATRKVSSGAFVTLRAPQKSTLELCLTREARYDFDFFRN